MIYLIAGHSDTDPGAVSNGLKEADLTKKVRDLVYTRIKELSPKIFVTKDNDKDSLSKVISKIKPNIKNDDVLVDFHYNSGSSSATGVECVVDNYAGEKSLKLAEKICKTISDITGLKNRGVKREKDTPRKQLGILGMKGSAVIVEMGFISNISDVNTLDKFLHWICEDIAHNILESHGN